MEKANIGFIGLGVMEHMLALNMERNGFRVAGYDLDAEKVQSFGTKYPGKKIVACATLADFLAALERPRRIMLMVPAGKAVDAAIDSMKDLLEAGDLLMDGGNTLFQDTERRSMALEEKGIFYIGTGISGGESGALWGPSMMPGGQDAAWQLIKPIFEAISAKVDGEPCVSHIGLRGAGHYVKMVHNGIEYSDMQLIAEAYDLLHRGLGLNNSELADVFTRWNQGELASYLVEISVEIFRKMDEETGQAVLDLILDEAAQKGTGKWASQNALDLGTPTPTITAAVEGRILSAYKAERVAAATLLHGPEALISGNREKLIDMVGQALYAAKLCSYAQGFALMRLGSQEYEYHLNFAEIARIWRGGCIIRASFLNDIRQAFTRNPNLTNLLVDTDFATMINARQSALRKVVALAAEHGLPVLALSSSLGYYDAYRSSRLPANLIQAQRDYFGAHTYRRVDREGSFHTQWVEEAG
jgi:6-phosphogluconate dehydrogenase